MSKQLFIFTFSPVQQFIAEARRAQDLFSGSKILCDLAKAALVALIRQNAKAIYPPAQNEAEANTLDDIPNKMTLILPDGLAPSRAGSIAEIALRDAWNELCKDAEKVARDWGQDVADPSQRIKLDQTWADIWKRQIGNVWECYWAATPLLDGGAYNDAYRQANRLLDAAKRPRAFEAAQEDGIKDTLSGSRSALRVSHLKDAREYWTKVFDYTKKNERFNAAKLRPKGRELLDAIGCVKRFGLPRLLMPTIPSTSSIASEDFVQDIARVHKLAALSAYAKVVKAVLGGVVFPARKKDAAARLDGWAFDGDLLYLETLTTKRLDQDYNLPIAGVDLRDLQTALKRLYAAVGERPRNYLAVLVMDGDAMGERVDTCKCEDEHRDFSKSLSGFAGQVNEVVKRHHGSKVYAGGDDVLALLPISTALACAAELAKLFNDTVKDFHASAGIAIGHHTQPLDGLLAEARRAEQLAKKVPHKDALAVIANKRSGERIEATAKWSRINTVLEYVKAFEPSLKRDPATEPATDPAENTKVPKYGPSLLSPRFAYDARSIATSFMPVAGALATREIRLAGYLSQLRQQLSQHTDQKLAQTRNFNLNALHLELSDWLRSQVPPDPKSKSTQPIDEADPETVANWLIVARFVAQRSDGGDE